MMRLMGGDPEREFCSGVSWPAGFVDLCRTERHGDLPAELHNMKAEAGDTPQYVFPLRDVERQFKVELRQGGEQQALGELSYSQLLRKAYPGAIHYYLTRPFRVYRINTSEKTVLVKKERHFFTKEGEALLHRADGPAHAGVSQLRCRQRVRQDRVRHAVGSRVRRPDPGVP